MDALVAQNLAEPLDTKDSVKAYRARLRRIEELAEGVPPTPVALASSAPSAPRISLDRADADIRARIAGRPIAGAPSDCEPQLAEARKTCNAEIDERSV